MKFINLINLKFKKKIKSNQIEMNKFNLKKIK